MKERPILFSAPMVRAILDGRKTQTRRVMKPQPSAVDASGCWYGRNPQSLQVHPCPYGVPGDRLWVREACRAIEIDSGLDGVKYLAGGQFRAIANTKEAADDWLKLNTYRGVRSSVVPSIHMPRWASRITLEITDVRVERLQDISSDDARHEGVEWDSRGWHNYLDTIKRKSSSVQSFTTLWESINGLGSWEANPFVWVIEFRRVKP